MIVPFGGASYALPQHLFTNSSLRTLKLSSCDFAPIGGLISGKSLRSLSFKSTRLNTGVMEEVLSGCPMLEIFEVRDYYGFNRLNVASSSLRELVLGNFDHHFDDGDFEDNYDLYGLDRSL